MIYFEVRMFDTSKRPARQPDSQTTRQFFIFIFLEVSSGDRNDILRSTIELCEKKKWSFQLPTYTAVITCMSGMILVFLFSCFVGTRTIVMTSPSNSRQPRRRGRQWRLGGGREQFGGERNKWGMGGGAIGGGGGPTCWLSSSWVPTQIASGRTRLQLTLTNASFRIASTKLSFTWKADGLKTLRGITVFKITNVYQVHIRLLPLL